MVRDIITGKVPMLPNTHYVMSDVRDIAKIHVAALENSQANGERFIVTSEKPYSFVGVASILKENGFEKASPRKAPSFMVKFMSLFNSEMKGMLPFVDAEVSADISSTKEVFNWKPIPFERTVVETAKSIQPLL
jgi:dihydroflavonol-4-reductase